MSSIWGLLLLASTTVALPAAQDQTIQVGTKPVQVGVERYIAGQSVHQPAPYSVVDEPANAYQNTVPIAEPALPYAAPVAPIMPPRAPQLGPRSRRHRNPHQDRRSRVHHDTTINSADIQGELSHLHLENGDRDHVAGITRDGNTILFCEYIFALHETADVIALHDDFFCAILRFGALISCPFEKALLIIQSGVCCIKRSVCKRITA